MKKIKKQKDNEEINKLKKEIEELKTGWQRTQADFENFRNRTQQEKEKLIKCSNNELISEILPVLDNFDIALKHKPIPLKDNEYIKGLEYIKIQIENILKNYGLEKINIQIGDQFDPTIHDAIETVSEKNLKKNQIAQIVSNGYKLNNQLLRPAKVKVVK